MKVMVLLQKMEIQTQGCWNLPTSEGVRSKVGGGQKGGILSKNLYCEGILMKILQKWVGNYPPTPPPGSNSPDFRMTLNSIWKGFLKVEFPVYCEVV